jgi:hypothetical protein
LFQRSPFTYKLQMLILTTSVTLFYSFSLRFTTTSLSLSHSSSIVSPSSYLSITMFGFPTSSGWGGFDPFTQGMPAARAPRRRTLDPYAAPIRGRQYDSSDEDDAYAYMRPSRAAAAGPRQVIPIGRRAGPSAAAPIYSRSPRYANERADDVEDIYGGTDEANDPHDPYARALAQRRREVQRQQALRKQQEAVLMARQQEDALRKRQRLALRRGQERAATSIQRAWRTHRRQRREAAAFIITRFIADLAAVQSARRLAESLRQLRKARAKIDEMVEAFEAAPRGYRHVLGYTDALEKEIISLDEVSHYGDGFVRGERRKVVRRAQNAIRVADWVTKVMQRRATLLQARLRRWQERQAEQRRHKAARVIQRALKAAPGVRAARRAAVELRALRSSQHKLAELREAYVAALTSLMEEARTLSETAAREACLGVNTAAVEAADIVARQAQRTAQQTSAELLVVRDVQLRAQDAVDAAHRRRAQDNNTDVEALAASMLGRKTKAEKEDSRPEAADAEPNAPPDGSTRSKRKKNKKKHKKGRKATCDDDCQCNANARCSMPMDTAAEHVHA